MTKKFKVPTWGELRDLVNSRDSEFEIRWFLGDLPEKLRKPMALALSVAKWSPENKDKDLGRWTSCGLCHTYFLELSCEGCPLETVGQGCIHIGVSAFNLWQHAETHSKAQEAKTRMFAILADLYRQAYDAYPKKPKYKKPK
jgi:hypothetical protein